MSDITTTSRQSAEPAPDDLQLPQRPEQTEQQAMTHGALNAAVSCAVTAATFLRPSWPSVGLTEAMQELEAKAKAVHSGDLRECETVLISQATTLNVLFLELARRAGLNMGANLQATDTYLRLALRAQNQSRLTLETLGVLKSPAVIFARQANINNGGNQQVVNNGTPAQPAAHAPKANVIQNGLLEEAHGERLDFGAQAAAGAVDSHMATVGAVHRPEDARGQGHRFKERRPGRTVAAGARGAKGTARKPQGAEGGVA